MAVINELEQHHRMVTYIPMYASKMTEEQKKDALRSLLFFTKKQYGIIKSHTCGDGSVKRRFPGHENKYAASPTVSTEAVIIIGAIEAHERRIVACFDISGAYLYAVCSGKGKKFKLLE